MIISFLQSIIQVNISIKKMDLDSGFIYGFVYGNNLIYSISFPNMLADYMPRYKDNPSQL